MRCEACQGSGKQKDSEHLPCERCGGTGIDHYCDGDRCNE